MKRLLLLLFVFVACSASGQESVTRTTPIVKSNTTCRISQIILEPIAGLIIIKVIGSNDEIEIKEYNSLTVPTGTFLLNALNTSNNSGATSLIKRIYLRLALDGICVGTVSGTPQ